ncbi:inositol monophosphatase family protein [Protofrankia symbiont of Coriaria ruscifolia]|uniref:inositol monophosphatase family protein n=1 Tax=Protofrankia symbiont of Coriaria ruscifolia TaxID=1306542 RepID=UPI0010411252|nr:inositol monophosphatase family protein [Protofrankia symbiont of Coriaria ruscifolia]
MTDIVHPALTDAAASARAALADALTSHTRAQLETDDGMGADGTPTMRIDTLVEHRILDTLTRHGVNVLSEEAGFLDRGSAYTVVLDPVDGSANAAAGVPLCALSAALAVDGDFRQALTCWLHTGDTWQATVDGGSYGPRGEPIRPSSTTTLDAAAVSLLRPHTATPDGAAWWAVARSARRIRVLSCSTLDIALVASGAIDAFADPGSDTHRLVDLAAGVVFARAGGFVLRDLHDRPLRFTTDLTLRWSGITAATEHLADDLASTIHTALTDPTRESPWVSH